MTGSDEGGARLVPAAKPDAHLTSKKVVYKKGTHLKPSHLTAFEMQRAF